MRMHDFAERGRGADFTGRLVGFLVHLVPVDSGMASVPPCRRTMVSDNNHGPVHH
jgi:hypothetical protein